MFSRMLLAMSMAMLLASMGVQAKKKFLGEEAFQGIFQDSLMPLCGGHASADHVAAVRRTVDPMWLTLPKVSPNRIDRRSFRYLAHRYFMQTSNLVIKGFEPNRLVNDTHWGVAEILRKLAPGVVSALMETDRAVNVGFSLTEAVNMLIMMEQLILDSENMLLRRSYTFSGFPVQGTLDANDFQEILENYIIEWIVEGDDEDMEILLGNRSLVSEILPHYEELMKFSEGRRKTFHHARQQKMPRGHRQVSNMFSNRYMFEDGSKIVGGITQTFASYWQSECIHMKDIMAAMDPHHTGRVPLTRLYNKVIDDDWRFGESETYLRDLGALDESSAQLGAQVIIPNYIQSSSNCIVSTPYYSVCCTNDCELILGEFEDRLQSPTASAKDILDVARNMSVHTSIDHEHTPTLPGKLTELLEFTAASSEGGVVPLHGRLFAQWLHYAFPRDCPFPHKSGFVVAMTPSEYGEDYLARDEIVAHQAANTTDAQTLEVLSKDELDWMSQWDNDEELIVDYSSDNRSLLGAQRVLLGVVGLVLLAFGFKDGIIKLNVKTTPSFMADHKYMV